MNSAQYVNDYLAKLKAQGLSLMIIAWKIALACVGWAYVFGGRGQYCTPTNRRARDWQKHPTIKSKCQVIRDNNPKPDCTGCKWFPNGLLTRFFDCRGLTYWVLKLVYGWELEGAGCTSQWDKASNWKAKGEIKNGIPQNVLCCVFYYKKDANGKRTSTLEHTGFYLNGETVECSNGVQYSKSLNKKWEVWAIPACVESEGIEPMPNNPVEEPSMKYPTLRKGDKGDWVAILQNELITRGYKLPRYGADGDFGSETLSAVKQFQRDHGLYADGVVGQKTWEAINGTNKPVKTYTVTISNCTKEVADEIVSKYGGTIT